MSTRITIPADAIAYDLAASRDAAAQVTVTATVTVVPATGDVELVTPGGDVLMSVSPAANVLGFAEAVQRTHT